MAKDAKGKGGKEKGKTVSVTKYYGVSGANLERKKKTCPKCGPGIFLADHSNRQACGRCGYTEFKKR
ncbi:MAG: 30S ribosomal protein S27ae [Thermoplasmata archaeon]